jgi:hypothetical protein
MRTRLFIRIIAVVLLASVYPAFVLGYTWSHVVRSSLSGGRHGPLDAYRHTLAGAVVGFTLGSRAVAWATWAMENAGKDAGQMDRHNNLIGASIGASARSFDEIEPAVHARVLRGGINASDPGQVTWLPPERWGAGRLW